MFGKDKLLQTFFVLFGSISIMQVKWSWEHWSLLNRCFWFFVLASWLVYAWFFSLASRSFLAFETSAFWNLEKKMYSKNIRETKQKSLKKLKPFSSSLTFLLLDTAAKLELSSSLSINFAGLFRLRTGRIWCLGLWLSETFKKITISKPKYWRKKKLAFHPALLKTGQNVYNWRKIKHFETLKKNKRNWTFWIVSNMSRDEMPNKRKKW